jgi:nitrite reductase/ring-hydroxylating ferredoxin subunit
MSIVGKASDIGPGEIKAFDVGGIRVAVTNSDGEFFAFDDLCTHEECSLEEEGEVEGTEVTCLCHFTVFDLLSGEVIDGPATEPLPVYEVRVVDGDLDISV